jgi:hypothetical protein
MSVLPAGVADHLDKVVAATRLLPSTDRVQALDTAVSVLQAEQAAAVRDLASDGSLDGSGCKTAGSWLRVHLRRGIGAHRITRRAEPLPELPGFGAAFAAGRVSEEHVDTVIRWTKPCGLAVIQDHEPTLVQLAEHATPRELEQALGVLADLANPDRDADQVAALADRFIRVHRLGDLVHVDAMVEPALGEALKTAVEAGATLPTGIKPADDGPHPPAAPGRRVRDDRAARHRHPHQPGPRRHGDRARRRGRRHQGWRQGRHRHHRRHRHERERDHRHQRQRHRDHRQQRHRDQHRHRDQRHRPRGHRHRDHHRRGCGWTGGAGGGVPAAGAAAPAGGGDRQPGVAGRGAGCAGPVAGALRGGAVADRAPVGVRR